MFRSGSQRALARGSSASATQTRAWAAATIRGRASDSRSAVARLIGNRRSFGAKGAASSLGLASRGDGGVAPGVAGGSGLRPDGEDPDTGGSAEGREVGD